MTFKNQKEEVLELNLTSYGKHLLSRGELNPAYYAFYDDDVLYDIRYDNSSQLEANEAQARIMEGTPRTRNQIYFFGVETEVERQIEFHRNDQRSVTDSFSVTIENDYVLSSPLSRSSLSSDMAPSWDFRIYGAKFESYLPSKQGSQHKTLNIPQIELTETTFYSFVTSQTPAVRQYSEIDSTISTYSNGNTIGLQASEFILEVDEEHTIPLSKNYDIEIYAIESIKDSQTGEVTEEERRLYFARQEETVRIVDDVLVEVDEELPEFEIDSSYVEYYLEVKFDTEIDKELLCELGYRTDYSKRGHIPVNCDDETDFGGSVYDSSTPKPPFGDDC